MAFHLSFVLLPLVAVYLTWPAPPLPDYALSHLQRGNFFWFKSSQTGLSQRIFYIDTLGDDDSATDRTLLLLHGFPIGSMDWNMMLPGLRKLYRRIIAPEQLGFGFSDKPAFHPYTMDEQSEIFESLLRCLGVDSVHVLSHDTGALVGQQMVLRFNRRRQQQASNSKTSLQLLSFTSINGPLHLHLDNQLAVQYVIHLPVVGVVLSAFGFEAFYRHNLRPMFGHEDVGEWIKQLGYAMLRHHDGHLALPKVFHYMKERDLYESDWIRALNATSIPVAYIFGPADFFHVRAGFELYRREVPHSHTTVLQDHVGHSPLWESPQAAVQAHREFLRQKTLT